MFGANPFGWPYFGQSYAAAASAAGEVDVPFIGSISAVYTPALSHADEIDVGFIASVAAVYTPELQRRGATLVGVTTQRSTNTIAVPAGVVDGDLLVLALSDPGFDNVWAVSGWTLRSHTAGLGILTKVASSEPSSYTVPTFTVRLGAMLAYRGVAAEAPDANATGSGLTAASLTPGFNHDLELYVAVTNTETPTLTPDSGFTQEIDFFDVVSANSMWAQDRVDYSSTSATGTVTPGGSGASPSVYAHLLWRTIQIEVDTPFISSITAVYALELPAEIDLPFIPSITALYALTMPVVNPPFISSVTRLFGIFSLFNPDATFAGPGNGGETFAVRLAPNGTSETATLTANITATDTLLELTGDGALPSTVPFCLTIDAEVVYVVQIAAGSYRIRGRGVSNTTPAAHTASATVTWTDHYDMAITAGLDIAHQFTADIASSGSVTYPGWLICYDSSQAYLGGSRYPMHVASVLGVFDAGAGSTGTNRCDAAQPNAIATAVGISDDCPAALSNPSRISSDILSGDVAVVRYTNPEASVLDLGPRAVALQSWFGLKRVNAGGSDVTFTDPNGIVVDTTGGEGTYTGSVNGEWFEPSAIGIGPDTGLPTPNPEPFTTVTLPGADRDFTRTVEKGWPICCLAVRQGNRRVPFWQSYDWHNFNYVYPGFGVDDTYAQILINRNGVSGAEPETELPGTQDIDGPNAVWDDATYYFGASWYVAIFNGPYLVVGPSIGGTPTLEASTVPNLVPTVSFAPLTLAPTVTEPPATPVIEGGSGGGISPAAGQRFDAALV